MRCLIILSDDCQSITVICATVCLWITFCWSGYFCILLAYILMACKWTVFCWSRYFLCWSCNWRGSATSGCCYWWNCTDDCQQHHWWGFSHALCHTRLYLLEKHWHYYLTILLCSRPYLREKSFFYPYLTELFELSFLTRFLALVSFLRKGKLEMSALIYLVDVH